MILFYHLFRIVYLAAAHLLALWQPKARKWVSGRKNWQQQLRQWTKQHPDADIIWMHCASLGEFEQGRPVAEALKRTFPHTRIVISFFSPSGYETARNSTAADYFVYLPFDSAANARQFISILQPRLAIFVKYEFWHFYLQELRKKNIPTLLISAVFRPNQPFFKWWGRFHRNMLKSLTHVFTQDRASLDLLKKIMPEENISLSGDTRFDRVCAIADHWQEVPHLGAFSEQQAVMVAGSTWPEDEKLLRTWHQKKGKTWKLIIAPHDINSLHLDYIRSLFPNAVFYSSLKETPTFPESRVLIIDNIGMLSQLYRYGKVCYIGGGFTRDGIHNILEAAVYGKPVFSGPEYSKYHEAAGLNQAGAYFPVNDADELSSLVSKIDVKETGERAAQFVRNKSGATARMMQWIQEKRLLTSA